MSAVSNPKLWPVVAAERAKLAAVYRDARKKNPAMARLVWRRIQRATNETLNSLWGLPS